MSNDLTNIMPKLLATGIYTYVQYLPFVMSANRDYQGAAAQKGDKINVPISVSKTATNVTPSGNRPDALPSSSQKTVAVELDSWKEVEFSLTDKDKKQIDKNQYFLPMDFHEAIKALSEAVETTVAAQYVKVYSVVGTAGTTPYASDTSASIDARKMLNKYNVPSRDRSNIVDADAAGNMLALPAFSEVDKSSDKRLIIDGEIGKKLGFMNIEGNTVQEHTTGAVGTPLVDGTFAAGVNTITVDGFTTKPSVGDVFSIAGNTQTYTVVSATELDTGESDLVIEPALAAGPADDAAVTFIGDHVANISMHRDALTFATRPLEGSDSSAADVRYTSDPNTGMALRLELTRAHKADVWSLDALWGSQMTRPYAAVRNLG